MPVGFASISSMKSPYKRTVQRVCTRLIVGKWFAVCSGVKTICIWHHNYRQVFNFLSRYGRKTKNRLPPKNYRRIALPPNKYRHILVYRFRQSRYRRKMKNRLPPANYRRMAIPPRLCPPKKPLPTTTLVICYMYGNCPQNTNPNPIPGKFSECSRFQ